MALTTEQHDTHSATVRDDGATVCEIRGLRLQNARFRPEGRYLIGTEVPLPLYWEQYADHEHPDRNAGSHGVLRIAHQSDSTATIECMGATASYEATSRYILSIERLQNPVRFIFDIQAFLTVPEQKSWLVTPNPLHGELEFCNFWPDGAFAPDLQKTNRYTGCYLLHGDQVTLIPHHHLESPDKHNLLLGTGDRLAWLLEDENPVIEILQGDPITAGICAYMWDAHLAVKACHDGKARRLSGGTTARAHFRLYSIGGGEGRQIVDRARMAVAPEAYQVPVIVDGVHTFAETLATTTREPADVWPWETEVEGDTSAVRFLVDRAVGYDDKISLCIDTGRPTRAAWKATALGPAFRQPPFRDGNRFSLSGFIRTHLTEGTATVALRLHREGKPGLTDPTRYEIYRSPELPTGRNDWTGVQVVTPPISPAPDRVHVLLEVNGAGQCWFDNVQLLSKA